MSEPNGAEPILIDTSDEDSIFGAASFGASNKSFASSVRDYLFENGRRYHAYRQGKYVLPNDEREQDRLDLVHCLFKEILNDRLYRAPLEVEKTRRILDLGTGTANWAIEIAERFPHSEIVGTDLSPIQPVWSPPNCRFFVDDMESEWTYLSDEAFDYIHGRVMGGSIGDWDRLLRQIKDHLKPGGWVEFQEYETTVRSEDGTHEKAKTVLEWAQKLEEASITYGKRLLVAPSLRQKLLDAGFVDVREDVYKCPIGSWPKDPRLKAIGRLHMCSVLEAVEPYSLALLTRVHGYSFDESQTYMTQVKKDFVNPAHHLYSEFRFIYGRKPL